MTTPPLRRIARRTVLRNAVFTVHQDDVEDRDGRVVQGWLTVEPNHRSKDGLTGAAVLPIVAGDVHLLRIYRYPIEREGLEIPRGFVDPGEEPSAAAARELDEELGLPCPLTALVPLGSFAPDGGVLLGRIALFAAVLDDVKPAMDCATESGHLGRVVLPPLEFEQRIADGSVDDPATQIAWLRYSLVRRAKFPA